MAETASGLFYEIHDGPRPDAPTVILSAGLGGGAGFWAPQMAALAEQFRVIGYDHRGTGRSVRTLTEPHSVDAMAHDIVEVLDAAGIEHAHLIGHAAGGLAGLALALNAPDRLDRLVVVNGWAAPDPYVQRCFDVRLALLRDSGPAAYIHAQALFLYPPAWISKNSDRLAAEEPHHVAAFPPPDVVRARIAAVLAWNVEGRLAEITTPVLVAAAADDSLIPVHLSEQLAAGLPNATLEITPWGGHAYSVTTPEVFNASVVRFLSGDGGT
ncbi:MAG: alpha/beta hydrolase fold [Phenylobacterium sp.]|nr:alpha/beta hydrolase fold [Phenylobacterium sp.]